MSNDEDALNRAEREAFESLMQPPAPKLIHVDRLTLFSFGIACFGFGMGLCSLLFTLIRARG